jgi:hypothetical protein
VNTIRIGQAGFNGLLINATSNGTASNSTGNFTTQAVANNKNAANTSSSTQTAGQPLTATAITKDGQFSFTGYFVDTVTQWVQGLLLTPNSMKFDFNCSSFQHRQSGTRLAIHGVLGVPKGTNCSKDSTNSSSNSSSSNDQSSSTLQEESITCDGTRMSTGTVGVQLMWVNKVIDRQGKDYKLTASDPMPYTPIAGGVNDSSSGNVNGTSGHVNGTSSGNGTTTGPLITNMDPNMDYYDIYWVVDSDQIPAAFTWDPSFGVAYYSSATRLHALSLSALLLLLLFALGLQS